MPTVTLNRKVLEKAVGKKLPLDKLKERISYLGTDLERINEKEIVVEIFPNRPDLLSEQGFARAFSSFIGVHTGLRKYKVKKSGYKVIVDKSVTMRPYTACAIIKNIKFTDDRIKEIMQMQEKLATTHGRNRKKSAYGVYPIEQVAFPIKYIAKDPHKVMFQPLGFQKKIPATEVEKTHPTGKKFKDIAKNWKKYPFFIDANENVMCMLPYTNSHDTGKVNLGTKEVFIECTGTDLLNVKQALNIFVTMFADMGADIYSLDITYGNKKITTPDLKPKKEKINLAYINKRLGLKLSEREMVQLLKRMGYGYEKKKVLVPAYRVDILHEVDFVEDIAIAYGYENIQEEIPNVATIGEENAFEKFQNKIAELCLGLGLTEVSSYYITNKDHVTKNMLTEIETSTIKNSLSLEHNTLRPWLIPSLLEILKNNRHHEYPQNIFEIGPVFLKKRKSLNQVTRVGIALCHAKVDYTASKQVANALFENLGLKAIFEATEHSSFIPGRVARVKVKGKKIAYVGEIHPAVLNNFTLDTPVAVLEINLSDLYNILTTIEK